MKIYKEQIIPIINHVVMEYESNIDSTNAVLKNSETIFTNYLKRHKGKIAPWLKNEAIRRKIL